MHPRRSVGQANVGTPGLHIWKGGPLHLEDTTVHLGVTKANRHHNIALSNKLEGRLAQLPQMAMRDLLSRQGLTYSMQAVLKAAVRWEALHLPDAGPPWTTYANK